MRLTRSKKWYISWTNVQKTRLKIVNKERKYRDIKPWVAYAYRDKRGRYIIDARFHIPVYIRASVTALLSRRKP